MNISSIVNQNKRIKPGRRWPWTHTESFLCLFLLTYVSLLLLNSILINQAYFMSLGLGPVLCWRGDTRGLRKKTHSYSGNTGHWFRQWKSVKSAHREKYSQQVHGPGLRRVPYNTPVNMNLTEYVTRSESICRRTETFFGPVFKCRDGLLGKSWRETKDKKTCLTAPWDQTV